MIETLTPNELLRPFGCSHRSINLYSDQFREPWGWYVQCNRCRRKTKVYDDSDDARREWRTRWSMTLDEWNAQHPVGTAVIVTSPTQHYRATIVQAATVDGDSFSVRVDKAKEPVPLVWVAKVEDG